MLLFVILEMDTQSGLTMIGTILILCFIRQYSVNSLKNSFIVLKICLHNLSALSLSLSLSLCEFVYAMNKH